MKKGMKIFLGILGAIVLGIILFIGYLGFIPGLSSLFGSDKPRDLGVTYTEADKKSANEKTKIVEEVLPASTPDAQSMRWTGSHEAKLSLSSSEATALMNNRAFKYWPYQNVQMKFNGDGSAEVSGSLDKAKLPGYLAAMEIPSSVSEKIVQFMPENTVFYLKGQAEMKENKLSVFEPTKVEIGRMSLPMSILLSKEINIVESAIAADLGAIEGELLKASGKKGYIIEYVNSYLGGVDGFYVKKANFSENALNFEGKLNDKELTVR